jgi:hypothetical protein
VVDSHYHTLIVSLGRSTRGSHTVVGFIDRSDLRYYVKPLSALEAGDWILYQWQESERIGRIAETDDPRWSASHVTTAENPAVTDEWLDGERADVDSLTWRSEYPAEFLPTNSDPYLPVEIVRPAVAADVPRSAGVRCWLGVDPAGSGDVLAVAVPLSNNRGTRARGDISGSTVLNRAVYESGTSASSGTIADKESWGIYPICSFFSRRLASE